MAKYINPYTDFGFKKLFGEEGNKNLLKSFLNQLLPEHHQIADLTFQNVEKLPDTQEERKAFFDIHCISSRGERFIVEMQKAKVDFFKDRSLYYLSYPIREQAKQKEWSFELSAVYFIAVLDFWYEDKKTAEFYRFVTLKDQKNELFYDKLGLIYLQMPAFKKTENELTDKFDKWAYFLKNLEKFEEIPQILNEEVFQQAFTVAELAKMTKAQREDYEKSRLNYIGFKQATETAEKDGLKKGLEQGLEQGKIEIAKRMKEKGMPYEEISELTGLPVSLIENI
ncbi:MAG: Rpn family recombination-promoting nuclease/putative transposase [Bacteroidia bacterium]